MTEQFDDAGNPAANFSSNGIEEAMQDEDVTAETEEQESEPEAEVEPEKVTGLKKRFRELTTSNRQYQEQIASLTESLRQMSQVRAATQAPQAPAGPPKPDAFDSPDDYLEAKVAYEVNARMTQALQDQQAKQSRVSIESNWAAQLSKARETYADFDEIVSGAELTQTMGLTIQDSSVGGEVAYYLGQHRDEAKRIAALSPLAQVRELGKIEARLESKADESRQQKTQTARPIRSVTARSSPERNLDKMNMDDFANYFDDQELKARQRGRRIL